MKIIRKIQFIFYFLAVVLFSLLYLRYKLDSIQYQKMLLKKYDKVVSFLIHTKTNQYNLQKTVKELGFKIENNPQNVIFKSEIVAEKKSKKAIAKILKFNTGYYLYIHQKGGKPILLKDLTKQSYIKFWLVSFILFGVLLFAYFGIMQSIKPLKELENKVNRLKNGDLDVSFKLNGQDEIVQISNMLDDALSSLKNMINSRKLFLRAIMHELKTPLARGRVLSSLLKENQTQEEFNKVFDRLEIIIDEFAKIEQLISNRYILKMHKFNISDILEQSVEMLMVDEDRVVLNIKELFVVQSDFNLITLLFKNLLDNAIKYSPDKKAEVAVEKNRVTIKNKGEGIKGSLEQFYEPFNSGSSSLGLGLYTVLNIAKTLDLKVEYSYKNKINIFSVLFR